MLSNDAIVQGLNHLVAPTLGPAAARTGGGLPRLFACWEAPTGYAVCKFLPSATRALFTAVFGRGVFGIDELASFGVPDAWLPKALQGPVSEWGGDDEARTAWMALPGGSALRWERTRRPIAVRPGGLVEFAAQDACGRIETDTPLWWDAEGLLAPLERFRAAIGGWPPVLPDSA